MAGRVPEAGAELVVWGEGSTLVSQDGESAFLDRVSSLARDERIDIVPAYAALPGDGTGPAHPFRNTLTWVTADGAVAETYLKHHPIPGEGSVPGTDPLGTVSFGGARVAGAIAEEPGKAARRGPPCIGRVCGVYRAAVALRRL